MPETAPEDPSPEYPVPHENTRRSRLRRWALPVGVLAVVLAVPSLGNVLSADAAPSLPHRSAEQLLVDVQNSQVSAMSGTVVQRSDLGLPELPSLGAGPSGSASLTSLPAGTHTLRVWYSGPDKARLALLGVLGESDVIVNGRDLWVWSSDDKSATHSRLPASQAGKVPHAEPSMTLTPQQAAEKALAALDPSTKVSTAGTASVAGRPVYELVLVPRDGRSLIGRVRIAIDAKTYVPLRVQVFATGHTSPAFEVGFTQVSFSRPDEAQFRFTPPPGTKVTERALPTGRPGPGRPDGAGPNGAGPNGAGPNGAGPNGAGPNGARIVGSGWTSVVVLDNSGKMPAELGRILATLPKVSGSWGSGRLLRSDLATVLITTEGRIIVGAVSPELLYAAASAK